MPLILPLIAWGAWQAIDTSPWTAGAGTPTITPGQTDAFGGTNAYKIDDNDAGTPEGQRLPLTLANGTQWIALMVRQDTSSTFGILVYEITGGTSRHGIRGTWSGGIPSLVTVAGGGTILTPIALGGGTWLCLFSADGVVAGNQPNLYLYGTDYTNAALTGSTIFSMRHLVLLDYLDDAVSWDEPRDGSFVAQSAGGVEDAWDAGTDEHLRGTVRWVPAAPRDTPISVSGWYGAAESPGINSSVKAMLRAGRDKNVLRWVPDRSVCTTYMDSYLVDPMKGAPDLEPNWDRKFALELRGSSVFSGY